MNALGLASNGRRVPESAGGQREAVEVTGPFIVHIEGRDTGEEAPVLGDEMLSGQMVLEKLDLFGDGSGHRLLPNPAHPDPPVTGVQ